MYDTHDVKTVWEVCATSQPYLVSFLFIPSPYPSPVPAPPNRSDLTKDIEALARRLRITHHFRNSRRQGKKHPFQPKSQWMPPKASNPKLEEYIEKTLAEEAEENTPKPNLSKKEMKSWKSLVRLET